MPDPIPRPASRVLLFDPAGRLLLFRVDVREKPIWITPGGGLESGETHVEAAHRELFEETGIEAALGPCVWTRRHVFEFNGVWLDEAERFYVVRLSAPPELTRDHWLEYEHTFMKEHRWWTPQEIAASDDWFAPRKLATLLPPIIAGVYPPEPFDCGV